MVLKAPWLSPVKRSSWERRQAPESLTKRSLKIMCAHPKSKLRVQRRMAISRKKNRKRNLCPGPGNSPSSTSKKLSRQQGCKLNYSKRSTNSMSRPKIMLNLHPSSWALWSGKLANSSLSWALHTFAFSYPWISASNRLSRTRTTSSINPSKTWPPQNVFLTSLGLTPTDSNWSRLATCSAISSSCLKSNGMWYCTRPFPFSSSVWWPSAWYASL